MTNYMTNYFTNYYVLFILAVIIGVYALDTLTDALNLGNLKLKLPDEFKEIFEAKKYQDSLNYQRDHVHFDLIQRTFDVITTLAFILLGGFNYVDNAVRSFGAGQIATGLLFFAALSILRFVINLPFSIYETFVLEAHYGFNKTTLATYCTDILKGSILGALFGSLIFSGIIYFFENMGPNAWAYSWLGVTAFQIVLMYLAPAVIMPLFNKFEPLPPGPLRDAIEQYASSRKFQLNGIFQMDGSKRSTKSNAFFTGFGKYRRLVLFDTLVKNHTVPELVSVIAHEVGHFEKKHIIKSMVLSILTTALIFYILGVLLNNPELFAAFKMDNISIYASLVFAGFIYSPLLRIISIGGQVLSRRHEFEADAFALETYSKPELLISALKKLSRDNMSHLTPHPMKVFLDYSHPPVLARIEALRRAAK
jgi:STE24 endopeptidase